MANKLKEFQQYLDRNLHDRSKPWTPYFDQLETKTGVNRLYLFIGMIAFIGLYLVFGFGAGLICNTIGFVYPAYMSMKALESPQKDDDTKWLTYWVVFASFSVFEYFSNFIVRLFPLYWLAKTMFIVWCFLPGNYNGSMVIYQRVIRPYYSQHHERIDEAASSGQLRALTQKRSHKKLPLTSQRNNIQGLVKEDVKMTSSNLKTGKKEEKALKIRTSFEGEKMKPTNTDMKIDKKEENMKVDKKDENIKVDNKDEYMKVDKKDENMKVDKKEISNSDSKTDDKDEKLKPTNTDSKISEKDENVKPNETKGPYNTSLKVYTEEENNNPLNTDSKKDEKDKKAKVNTDLKIKDD